MTRPRTPPSQVPGDLTPEESRFLDGVLPAAEARRLERQIAADPHRSAGLQQDRDAAALWRDDAQRTAADVVEDVDVLADRVLARVGQGPTARERRRRWLERLGLVGDGTGRDGLSDRTVLRYAAAAVMLMAVGIGGTWLVRANRATAEPIKTPATAPTNDPSALNVDDALWDGMATGLRRPVAPQKPGKRDGR